MPVEKTGIGTKWFHLGKEETVARTKGTVEESGKKELSQEKKKALKGGGEKKTGRGFNHGRKKGKMERRFR